MTFVLCSALFLIVVALLGYGVLSHDWRKAAVVVVVGGGGCLLALAVGLWRQKRGGTVAH